MDEKVVARYFSPHFVGAVIALAFSGLVAAGASAPCSAHDWPQLRGPNQEGVSHETGWSYDWGEDGPRRLWERDVGAGNGQPAVVDGRLYVIGTTGAANETDTVYCLSAKTGEVIWSHSYQRPERTEPTPTRRGPTNTTPTVHDGRVYTYSGDAQFFCFDAATGRVLFRRDLIKEIGARHPQYDYNASPVVAGDVVILLVWLPDASIMAFDKFTGKEVWRAYHRTRVGGLGGFWSTPVYRQIDGKPCLVYLPGLAVVGLDPATGRTQWKYDFVAEKFPMAERGAMVCFDVSAPGDHDRQHPAE